MVEGEGIDRPAVSADGRSVTHSQTSSACAPLEDHRRSDLWRSYVIRSTWIPGKKRPINSKQQLHGKLNIARFASAEDRDEFARTPEKYAPQYGGYCAYGVSQGHTAPIDPEAWTILEGKLYLNYSKGVKKTWSEAIPKHIEEANRNWPGLHK